MEAKNKTLTLRKLEAYGGACSSCASVTEKESRNFSKSESSVRSKGLTKKDISELKSLF